MKKSGAINYRDSEVTYSVFGTNKHYSALAKIILLPNGGEIIKSVRLNNEHPSAINAEEKILQKSFALIRGFYEKNYFALDNNKQDFWIF